MKQFWNISNQMYLEIDKESVLVIEEVTGLFSRIQHLYTGKVDIISQKYLFELEALWKRKDSYSKYAWYVTQDSWLPRTCKDLEKLIGKCSDTLENE